MTRLRIHPQGWLHVGTLYRPMARQIDVCGIWRDLAAPLHARQVCASRNSARDLRFSS